MGFAVITKGDNDTFGVDACTIYISAYDALADMVGIVNLEMVLAGMIFKSQLEFAPVLWDTRVNV